MITSAVAVVAALLAVLAVLVAKARRGNRLAAAGYVEPMPFTPTPHHNTAEPDEGDQWRRHLLEAIEAAADGVLPGALHGQENPRPETSSPVPGTDPQETAAWTPPFEPFKGPLESLFNSEPSNRVGNLPETSPFDPFAPAESDPDSEYHGRRRRDEHPATDEAAAGDTPPGDTP